MGLHGEHLQERLAEDDTVFFLKNLKRFIVACVNGKAPQSLQPHFGGANLTAAEKKLTDVRSLAAGETLRRLIAKNSMLYGILTRGFLFFFPSNGRCSTSRNGTD